MGKNEILNIINTFPVSKRLELIQSILADIKVENELSKNKPIKSSMGKDLMEFAAVWDESTAKDFQKSLSDCRKIDLNEW